MKAPMTLLPARKGNRNEKRVETWLRQRGLRTVERNYHCRYGEIDLIMRAPDGTLVFIETRYRENPSHGGALASVDQHKQRRLINTARHYLASHALAATGSCRFDVVAVAPERGERDGIEWITNAFLAE
jgi:putative endonuclease